MFVGSESVSKLTGEHIKKIATRQKMLENTVVCRV